MADLSELTSKALQIVGDAQGYLMTRQSIAVDPLERASIQDWHATLQNSAAILASRGSAINPMNPAVYNVISQQLDLTHQIIQGLHEWYDYPTVDLAIRNLHGQLQMLAGPHGPGGGRPRGGGVL
jgi:hypothetical protein